MRCPVGSCCCPRKRRRRKGPLPGRSRALCRRYSPQGSPSPPLRNCCCCCLPVLLPSRAAKRRAPRALASEWNRPQLRTCRAGVGRPVHRRGKGESTKIRKKEKCKTAHRVSVSVRTFRVEEETKQELESAQVCKRDLVDKSAEMAMENKTLLTDTVRAHERAITRLR